MIFMLIAGRSSELEAKERTGLLRPAYGKRCADGF
jgi:hypothetical protein